MSQNGKGSAPRPMQISRSEFGAGRDDVFKTDVGAFGGTKVARKPSDPCPGMDQAPETQPERNGDLKNHG